MLPNTHADELDDARLKEAPTAPAANLGTRTLVSWGGETAAGYERLSEDLEQITLDATLSRGLGRSYGDASLPARSNDALAGTILADRILAFDECNGVLRAEAGLSLRQLNRVMLPRCWFVPVSPGTQDVTLGGMVAADVHGKNHHRDGCFGRHVHSLKLRVADNRVIECSPHREPELFYATLGGMGLTGHILEVDFSMVRIPSPWILCETYRIDDLERLIEELRTAGERWPFTVCWADCLARGKKWGGGCCSEAVGPIRRKHRAGCHDRSVG